MARIKIEDIRAELAQDNWKVISEEYVNLDTEMIFECPEGHKVYSSWKKIRQKRECPTCAQNYYKKNELKVVQKQKGVKRILALDQATHITGWSVYDGNQLVKYGIFETTLKDEIERGASVKQWLINMIENWKPDIVGIEDIHLQEKNQSKSSDKVQGILVFKTLARFQGVILNLLFERKIEYAVCSPSTWRQHCGVKGNTKADKKRAMQFLVKKWFDVSVTDDEADAIGIGKYLADTATAAYVISDWE